VSLVRLGLIGDNITASRSPHLHRAAARMTGIDLSYELLVPAAQRLPFDRLFERCRVNNYTGLNITYPYKEQVCRVVRFDDTEVQSVAACNTVLFGDIPPRAFNTDYTGFISAFRHTFGDASPRKVAIAGAGGVGKAIAFGLAQLGATKLRIFDLDPFKGDALRRSLLAQHPQLSIELAPVIEDAVQGADGLVNATPLGMSGIGGCAFSDRMMRGASWAFDAVYTPVETEFIIAARRVGLSVMTGYELYFYQGVNAFRIFTGGSVDEDALREALHRIPERQPIA
jgi:shikimate dehydrogenase